MTTLTKIEKLLELLDAIIEDASGKSVDCVGIRTKAKHAQRILEIMQ